MSIELKNAPTDNLSELYYVEPEIRKYNPTVNLNDDPYYTRPNKGPVSVSKGLDIADMSNLIMYGLMAFCILYNLYLAIFRPENLTVIPGPEKLLAVFIIVDAVIYNMFVERNILLILISIVFNGLYPVGKGWITDKEINTKALLLWIGNLISTLILFGASLSAMK